ncbi:tetratricopeptide repeat protein [Prochlorococcus marinus]|uniref:SAM-dependent methyltransferase n=1 Tax=Prochlorococcus marinus XMU1408 TaxID=2213228 RepID=A0A318R2L4_PROMR|nr:tetratricopeptide repeat protein [Prochlorococcus marinus]MBW3042406.1 SAM-dependent methyltransferase [Prochlorococcus marinus str. XMU1408]PYE01140.1 SAM-dependent methyltransferase [Prochlorococcus marinus XMU1408]
MGGFGKKKQENKGSSKKLLKLPEKELRARSINNHLKGKLVEAEKGYLAYIKNGFYDADIFSNYALICEEKGELDKAIKLYEKCTLNSPNHIFSKFNLSFLYYKLNNLVKAEILIENAIELNPNLPNGYCIKGLILKKLNKYNDSKKSLNKAIEIDPNYFDAYINLGLLSKDYNKYNDAEKYYLKAIKINSNSAIAHLNLGACYKEKLEIDKAILYTEIAIKLDSKLENSYLNLATIYNEKGDYNKSIELAKKELTINQKSDLVFQLISEILKTNQPLNISEKDNREYLKNILNRKDISHRELFGSIDNLISNQILEKLSILKSEPYDNKEFNILIRDKELIKALSLLIFCSPLWEKVLRNLRKNLLIKFSEGIQVNNNILNFTIALGSQCFINEYVYYISEEEKYILDKIKNSINKNTNQDYKLALISCYQSLYSINSEFINLDSYISNNKEFNKLLDLQFNEVSNEKNISSEILKVGNIDDLISKEVKSQYELNPYPRWIYNSYAKEKKVNFLSIINSEIYPNSIDENLIKLTDKKLNILIAGCGTGIQVLEASRYNNCEITAIDLSNASISYAKRKVDEYGMTNIKFIEMDLLELKQLDKKFDLIECSGVLHHMKDPARGLSNLVDSLEPRGFLKLGLYSKYARQEILRAREIIKEKKINPSLDKIRSFRNDVLNGDLKQLNEITDWSDFYSTSMCRDLCFHSQEKCYSLIEIKKIIEISNLEFLGFTLSKDVKNNFQSKYKNINSLKDLKVWDKFEKIYPNSFREMYQFWTRKSIK